MLEELREAAEVGAARADEGAEAEPERAVAPEQLPAALEALLFAAGDPLTPAQMSACTGYAEGEIRAVLEKMREDYAAERGRGLWLRQVKEAFVLSTKPELKAALAGLFKPRALSPLTQAAYEVLAVVAYNQPVTRAQVEAVRGVNSDSLMTRLEERGYIANTGTLDAPGRPGLYETTQQFLLEMDLKDARDLPPMEMLMYSSLQSLEAKLEQAQKSGDTVNELL